MNENADAERYLVVVNDEEQYSIWPEDRPIPGGWKDAGRHGTKSECLEHIERVWTDMRPRSVRRALEERPAMPLAPAAGPIARPEQSLASRLAEVEQPIALASRAPSRGELEAQLGRRRLYIRFERTGTELGIPLTPAAADEARSGLGAGASAVVFQGALVLDARAIRVHGTMDAKTLRGTARVELDAPGSTRVAHAATAR